MRHDLFLQLSSGISGDMFTSAILDMKKGMESNFFKEYHQTMSGFAEKMKPGIKNFEIEFENVERRGIRASRLSFHYTPHENTERSYRNIQELLRSLELDDPVRESALRIFEIIAQAEAKIHNKKLDEIHFHEVGSEDSILDVISAAWLYHEIGSPRIFSTAVSLAAQGEVDFSHGKVSLPTPAVLEILKGIPVKLEEESFELTTPTGAAIVKGLDFQVEKVIPDTVMIEASGFGAGKRDLKSRPNVLRVSLYRRL